MTPRKQVDKGTSIVTAKEKPDPVTENPHERIKALAEQRRLKKLADDAIASEYARPAPKPITEGPVDKIVEVLVNPSPEKMLEVTDLDRNQVSLIPQVLVTEDLWDYMEQVVMFRSDKTYYEKIYSRKYPETPDTSGRFVQLLARCRRSLNGKTQKALEDLALADLETRHDNEDMDSLGHGFED